MSKIRKWLTRVNRNVLATAALLLAGVIFATPASAQTDECLSMPNIVALLDAKIPGGVHASLNSEQLQAYIDVYLEKTGKTLTIDGALVTIWPGQRIAIISHFYNGCSLGYTRAPREIIDRRVLGQGA